MPAILNPVVVIPARLQAANLPGKPLLDIHGDPLIVHVWRRAVAAAIGPVVVACAEREIQDAVIRAGGNAILTRPDHRSSSDRVFEAVEKFDPEGHFDTVVNLHGDLPAITPAAIRAALLPLDDPAVDVSTVITEITDDGFRHSPGIVKAVVGLAEGQRSGRAIYFSRAAVPAGEGPLFHHIGLYAFRRATLERFVALETGVLEQREGLEQLRAIENGMRLEAVLVANLAPGVDTPADLERLRKILVRLH
ncbi:3-deoxy-manno-octulosonate cytidylyltransferase [Telmatospirillum siberiense]|uniref:3-deoxy-manno-octulosonate cytidylyltransferase n=1 Tax=Telmatospirillum siberiense TaxID=382514 RepID=A0A2N3Q0M1_9PROT|nr:3-deoxy-manno-octulosonate cytidylyltransferase [Telmatospirillum siberiense]PKU26194.1 3-deoxy-manno-octulosonate cytidylyltransferase [Telmatospirillum siberiense]